MIWRTDPTEVIGNPNCYCEIILQPNDLMLQGRPISPVSTSTALEVIAYDGKTGASLGNISSSFTLFIGVDGNGKNYFNLRLDQFPNAICETCFFLRIKLTTGLITVFLSYTDLYCVTECCAIPKGVVFTEGGVTIPTDPPIDAGGGVTSGNANLLYDVCGLPYLYLESRFNCYDRFTGYWYGDPKTSIKGSAFIFKKVAIIRGTMRPLARVSERITSEFCRIQKVTTSRQYDVQSFDKLAAWRKDEIEDMLCAPEIYVNNVKVVYGAGDPAFIKLYPKVINSLWRFQIKVSDCPVWQIFGCNTCDIQPVMYYGLKKSSGQYYTESGQLIATSYDELTNYFYQLPGVTMVNDLDTSSVSGPVYKVFSVEATDLAILPEYLYVDSPLRINKVYGRDLGSTDPDLNSLFGYTGCVAPIVGEITFYTEGCDAPQLGTITFADDTPITGTITANTPPFGFISGSVVRTGPAAVLSIDVYDADHAAAGEGDIAYGDAIIGFISSDVRPTATRYLTHADNSSIPDGSSVTIQADGTVMYSGFNTGAYETFAEITLTDLNYAI